MRKIMAFLTALILLAGGITASAEDFDILDDSEEGEEEAYLYTGPDYDPDTLVIGNPTPLSGNFTTQMWGYNTSDVDVTALVNGYNLIRWDHAYNYYEADASVVNSLNVIEKDESQEGGLIPGDVSGNRTYVFTLNEELKYSDGTPITAADYAFSILLNTSPEARLLGGNTDNYAALFGVEEYRSGSTKQFAGVRILNEHTLSLTVKKEYLPFFYELGYLRCYPMPIHIIAPGCTVTDDGQGAYIDGTFNYVLLEFTLLDPTFGYVSHPAVVSGPYKLLSYDEETHTAAFEINPEYLGNYEGQKPSIKHLVLRPADNGTMLQELEAGQYGLLNKVLKKDAIQEGLGLVQSQNYSMKSYARTGMSFLSINCEQSPVSSEKVRQAISYCLDKEETVKQYCGPYGIRLDGYYGAGQWMYQLMTGALGTPAYEEQEEENGGSAPEMTQEEYENAWAELSLDGVPVYGLDVDRAVQLLEEDGWVLNEDGDPFDPAMDDYRCRRTEEGRREKLDLTLEYPVGNEIGDILKETFLPYLTQAGIRVTLVPVEWQKLLREYYRQEERNCHLLFLGSNFFEVFDARGRYDPADAETGLTNYTGINDPELYRLACDMAMTNPGDTLSYETRWIAFQKRYQEAVPEIPVYTNAYFDFYTRWLQNYNVSETITWTDAILYAYMSDPTVPEEEELAAQEIFALTEQSE